MSLFSKRYLLLSSVLFLVLVSCRISKYKYSHCDKIVLNNSELIPIIKDNQPLKYKATIDVLKNHLTGILIIKQIDSMNTHFVFVTELGMKMFDFVYANHTMKAEFVFDPINKPKLINALMQNFENIFLLNAVNRNACEFSTKKIARGYDIIDGKKRFFLIGHYDDSNDLRLITQETYFKKRRASTINYTSELIKYGYSYRKISSVQYGFIKIYTELNEITPTND